jgi:N-acetylglucosaminyldiphosphoundecaprenol N-acetyl-beta-D-mannosaminyltransferase
MRKNERVRILDTPVDAVTMHQALEYVDGLVRGSTMRNYVLAVNPEKVEVLRKDTVLKGMFEKAALLLPDGIGIVLAVRVLFGARIERVSSADLMQNLCRLAPAKGYRIFIYGSKEEVNQMAVEKLLERNPGVNVVGRCHGYVKDEGMEDLVDSINRSCADILFVALGSPRQEKWIERYLPRLQVKVCQGIGGTLDTIAGTVKRAPVFVRQLGLEWFYRLVTEPRRVRRQLVLPAFAFNVLKEKLRSLHS